MDKQTKLLAELLSASELMVIDQFMQLMVKNNTFKILNCLMQKLSP